MIVCNGWDRSAYLTKKAGIPAIESKQELGALKSEPSSNLSCSLTIRQDSEGRYCLNDLHKAAGGQDRHKPKYWTALAKTNELVLEVAKGGITPLLKKHGGLNKGTFVVKPLVYAYAMWISAAFSLEVINAYDQMVTA